MPLGKKRTPTPPPVRPGTAAPRVDKPTKPTPPLRPKPDQQGAALRTATGTPVGPDGGEQIDPEERDRAQQSAHLTTSTGARLRETDHSLKAGRRGPVDRKSTRLNSSHVASSYAVFCLKKKNSHRH